MLYRNTQKSLYDTRIVYDSQFKTSFLISSNSCFQLKFHALLLVIYFKSDLPNRITSVWKLSPETVFRIEFVSLSMIKPCSVFFESSILQRYKNPSSSGVKLRK